MSDDISPSTGSKPKASGKAEPPIAFLLDKNLGLPADECPWTRILPDLGIKAVSTTDLPSLDKSVVAHEPDIVYLPIADFHRLFASVRRGRVGRADPLRPVASHVALLGDCQGVIDLDAEVPHGTFDFGMAQ